MNIYVVTPSYNAAATINRTIASVLFQRGDFSIYYHVQDGGSSDGTVEILARWQQLLSRAELPLCCRAVHFSYASQSDDGMYDALQQGFRRFPFQEHDWLTWINADDIILPESFALIAKLQRTAGLCKQVHWLTGQPQVLINDALVRCPDRLLNAAMVRAGLADGISTPFIQQEGTFFRGFLWQKHHELALAGFCYAGDWSLWKHFAGDAELYYADIPLGVFSFRADQISRRFWHSYMLELMDHNDYDQPVELPPCYHRLVPAESDGHLMILSPPHDIEPGFIKSAHAYRQIRQLLQKRTIALQLPCARLFVFGYGDFSRHLFHKITNFGEPPLGYIVSGERFTDLEQPLVLTFAQAQLTEQDLLIITNFRDGKAEQILADSQVKARLVHWTALAVDTGAEQDPDWFAAEVYQSGCCS